MNKNIIIGGIVVVALVAVGAFALTRKDAERADDQTSMPAVSSENMASNAPESGEKSLRDLLALNVAQQCTFSDDGNKGTTYISNGKVRGDFTTMVDGKSMEGHMIMSDNTNYFWTDASNSGFKMAIGETTDSSSLVKGDVASESIDIDKKGNYSCSPWVASGSMFALPSGVEFTDLGQMMQNIKAAQ